LDGFFRPVLLLLQEGVTRDAFGRLRRGGMAQETIVDGQRLGFVLGLDEQVKQVAIINRRAFGLFHARIEVAQRLGCLCVQRRLVQNRQVRLDGVLHAVLFEKLLRAFQMLVDVGGHLSDLPLDAALTLDMAGSRLARTSLSLYTRPERRPNQTRAPMGNPARATQAALHASLCGESPAPPRWTNTAGHALS